MACRSCRTKLAYVSG
ncbi:hypothetical protein EB233_06395 [Mesorhizobium erdmanii]|uniref:Uncharacterized protein n=1 Tax=Mesorhizobium erdmanii TaxID=1777866 RepID=A0A6M7UUK0_9HYPH|nr:hypothetical protein EB233_06395 [Mesorhizobium erdmanii]